MRVTPKSRLQAKLQHLGFVAMMLVVCGLIAFLSYRYNFFSDWTFNNKNSHSQTSIDLLEALEQPPVFTIYAPESGNARQIITDAVKQYQQVLPEIKIYTNIIMGYLPFELGTVLCLFSFILSIRYEYP